MTRRSSKPPQGERTEETVVQPLGLLDVIESRWRIEKKIGSGSMGSVFSAWDLEAKERVAVKILSPELCRKPPFIARFEREARLMATLDHPNLVPLLAIGRRGALPFLVMPYLEGMTLAEHLQQRLGKLAPVETHRIIKQVCAGLTALHAQKLVHRDVKPQNIFLSPEGHVTLLDLGVARDRSNPGLTRPGVRIGTPYYMAPEQILGQQDVDHRADLYALGALVFELFTGVPPFLGQNHHEVLRAHRELAPPDASKVSQLVSRAAAEVLMRALSKSPRDRYQSAADFLSALEDAYDFDFEGDDDRTSPNLPVKPELRARARAALKEAADDEESHTKPTPAPALASAAARTPLPSPAATPGPTPAATSAPSLANAGAVHTTPQLEFPRPTGEVPLESASRPTAQVNLPEGAEVATGEEDVLHSGFELLPVDDDNRRETEREGGGGVVRVIPLLHGVVTPAQVQVDGKNVGSGSLSLTLSPGKHRVRVQRNGFKPVEKDITVSMGERMVVRMELDQD